MGTNVYIDGFNLYYGAVKNTFLKWLDIGALCATLLPGHQIHRIRYFTARVTPLQHDQQAPARQDIFLRALKTIPNLTLHEGRFASHAVLMPQFPLAYRDLRNPPLRPPQSVQVLRTEEKGSDVNLATYLVMDGFDGDFDEAAIISNDADLVLPINIVTNRLRKPTIVINPGTKGKMSGHLITVATRHLRTINKKVLANCQFPPTLTDAQGTITKPSSW